MENGLRQIPLTKGKIAIVDDDDFDSLSSFKWLALEAKSKTYAARCVRTETGKKWILMHRLVAGVNDIRHVDHENGNGLDNRKANLRACTPLQNSANTTVVRSKSGFKGVSWHKLQGRWMAQIGVNYKVLFLGYYDNPSDAARAYDAAAKLHFGKFAKTNSALEKHHGT